MESVATTTSRAIVLYMYVLVGLFLTTTSIEGMIHVPVSLYNYCFTYHAMYIITYTAQQFTIEPKSGVQAEGLLAEFECLSPGAISYIYAWFVNDLESTSSNFSVEIRVAGGTSGRPSVLTIPASSQFNNSVIQCAAVSLSGAGVLSKNATLVVGEWNVCRLYNYLELLCFFSQSVHLLKS